MYDVLVNHAGAPNTEARQDFLRLVTAWSEQNPYETHEYRFKGSLGMGGKFWLTPDSFHVSYYTEDETPARARARSNANAALRELFVRPEVCEQCEYEKLVGQPSPNPHACEE